MIIEKQLRGIISLVIATLIYGFHGILSRLIGMDFGVFFQAFARNLIALFLISIYIFWRKSWNKIDKEDYKWFGIMILPSLLGVIALFVAFNNLTIGTVFFVLYASLTLGGYVLGRLFFQEKLTKIKVISLLICLLGLFVIFSTTLEQGNIFYLFLAVIAGLGMTSWNVFSKKVSSKYSLAQVFLVDCLISMILSFLLVFISNEQFSVPNFSTPWISVFLYAISAVGAGLLTINGFRYLEAQTGSLITLFEPVFGIFLGWLFFKESLTLFSIVGGILILLGAATPYLGIENKNR